MSGGGRLVFATDATRPVGAEEKNKEPPREPPTRIMTGHPDGRNTTIQSIALKSDALNLGVQSIALKGDALNFGFQSIALTHDSVGRVPWGEVVSETVWPSAHAGFTR